MSQQEAEQRTERKAEVRIALGFLVTVVASLALAVVYRRGGQPQLAGPLLALALGGLGYGFVTWGEHLLPSGGEEQQREQLATPEEELEAFDEELDRAGVIKRRRFLWRMLGAAAAAFGAAAFFPIRSLGPGPGKSLEKTSWKRGSRLVDEEGRVVRAEGLPVGSFITVFPEGHAGSADDQTVLVKVEEAEAKHAPGREDWAPEGLFAYSKLCTHAACPVGLYQVDTHQLLCPCHQSAFDVLDAAKPIFGPAKRPLPQLPLEIGPDGVLRARGDFDIPVGPAYWTYP